MIYFENVDKFILKDINIHIPKGCCVGLIGASGAGKTTFLRLVCGLLKADNGRVYVDGQAQNMYSSRISQDIGVLFTDKPILNGEECVYENFLVLKNIYRIEETEFYNRYMELANLLDFKKYEYEKVKNLSLGQRRRAELGAIFLHRPKLAILDEPTNGLDANGKKAFYNLIKQSTAKGMTILISSHDLEGISRLCSRVALLHKGRLIYYGSEELLVKKYVPVDMMELKLKDKLPDLEDLPIEKYSLEGDRLILLYNSGHITAAEILRNIMSQIKVQEIKISKPELTDTIIKIIGEDTNE